MACFQIARSGFSPTAGLRSGLPRLRFVGSAAVPFRCRVQDGDSDRNGGEEPTESLFMKELKRRGMTPTSLMEDGKRGLLEVGEKEMDAKEESRGKTKRNGVASAEYEKGVMDQRDRSMALNSEGLEGLIPRAKILLTLGGTFFYGFWPLILIVIASFAALYLYFGPTFVHDGSKMPVSPPPYVDPYALLEDERISQIAPNVK